jgi:phospholipid/cholesterol/gamma-HCH transport system substrate-binding protein
VELTRGVVPLRDVTVRKVQENGKERDGAFAASAEALRGGVEPLSFFRPYTPDLVGWFDDFSHSGIYDALGAASRVGLHASAFALLNGQLTPVPPALRDEAFGAAAALRQDNRCPGAAEHKADDGSGPWKPSEDFNCDLSQVLPGD